MTAGAAADRFVPRATGTNKPARKDECLALVNAADDRVRHQPTLVTTVLHHAADDPGLLGLRETWRNRDDLSAVPMQRRYRAEHEARLPALLRAPRRMEVLATPRADFAGGAER